MTEQIELQMRSDGSLAFFQNGQLRAAPVSVVLAFPFSAPSEGLAIVNEYSQELVWLDSAEQLSPATQAVLHSYLAQREFRPTITRIVSVSTFSTPSRWVVETEEGRCQFELPSDESIRRLGGKRLLLTHDNGMQFLIEDFTALDPQSRRLLARFMA